MRQVSQSRECRANKLRLRRTYPLQVLYLSGERCVHLRVLSVSTVHIPLQCSIAGVRLLKRSNQVHTSRVNFYTRQQPSQVSSCVQTSTSCQISFWVRISPCMYLRASLLQNHDRISRSHCTTLLNTQISRTSIKLFAGVGGRAVKLVVLTNVT
jgi:hypothetical protein